MSGEGEENDRARRMRDKEAEAGGQEGDGKVNVFVNLFPAILEFLGRITYC